MVHQTMLTMTSAVLSWTLSSMQLAQGHGKVCCWATVQVVRMCTNIVGQTLNLQIEDF